MYESLRNAHTDRRLPTFAHRTWLHTIPRLKIPPPPARACLLIITRGQRRASERRERKERELLPPVAARKRLFPCSILSFSPPKKHTPPIRSFISRRCSRNMNHALSATVALALLCTLLSGGHVVKMLRWHGLSASRPALNADSLAAARSLAARMYWYIHTSKRTPDAHTGVGKAQRCGTDRTHFVVPGGLWLAAGYPGSGSGSSSSWHGFDKQASSRVFA